MFQYDELDPLAMAPGETTKANEALNAYAQLGPGRSLSILAEEYQKQHEVGTLVPTRQRSRLGEWSGAFAWAERVAAYDEIERKRFRESQSAKREERAAELDDRNWQLATKLAERVAGMLDFPLAKVEQITKTRKIDDRTTVVEMNVVQPARWSFQTAAIMADIASKLGALATGEATDRTAHVIDGMTPRDLENMPLDQLLALRAQVERGKR